MDFALHIIISIAHALPAYLGYNLVFGKGKILHFGPLGVSLIVVYALYLPVLAGYGYGTGIGLALLVSILVSAMMALLSLRLPSDSFGVLSIALHLAALATVLNWTSFTRGALGLPGIPRLSGLESIEMFAIASSVSCLLFVLLFWLVDRSRFGRALSALSEHDWHARALGIHRTFIVTGAFLLLGLAHVHGNLWYGQYVRFISPQDYQFHALVFSVMVVVAGKPGSVRGVILSAILLTLLREGLRFVPLPADILGPVRLLLFGCILFAVVWWRRDSLFPKQRSI